MPGSSKGAAATPPRLQPKHVNYAADQATRISGLIPRPKRRRQAYFVVRESGERFREWVRRNLEDSPGCYAMDMAMAVLSLFVVVLNVYTYWGGIAFDVVQWIKDLDFSINLMFTLEYLVRLYAAFDRVSHFWSMLPLAELVVLVPSWLKWTVERHFTDDAVSHDVKEVSIVLRSLRVLRLFRFLEFTRSSLERQILAMLVTIACITLSTAGILQVVEACLDPCASDPITCQCQNLSYLDLLYFVVVSISTLGYGDIAPVSTTGKFLIAFIILLTFIVVPIQISRVSKIISSHTDYSSSYTESKRHPHVVITGHIDVEMLSVFISEFFHPSNLNWNEKLVILNPSPPTVEVKKVLNANENKVKYIVGSPMLDEDLDRAVLQCASACFVLVKRNAVRPQHADQCSALITIALRRGNPTCPIYAQVINAENAATILKMGASDVVVAGAMKFSILGRSCEMYGLPTLLFNLLAQSHSDLDSRVSPAQWQKTYLHGAMHGVFLVDIPRTFSGLSFGDLIKFLYEKTPVVPLALLTEDGVQFPDMEFKLGATADPNLCCKVYAIAKGLTAVEQVLKIPPEQVLSYRKNTRRKARSMVDVFGEDVAKRTSKPALGSEFEKIRQSLITSHKAPTRHSNSDEDSAEYADFTSSGVPPGISQHVIVCGFPADTYEFLKTVREASPQNEQLGSPPVVFLAPAVIDEDEFARIKHFPDVYFVLGSPVNFVDLKKTRIDLAISVLVLTQTTESPYSDPNMIDADAITTLRYIVEIRQKTVMPNLVVELDKPTNVKLLSSLATDHLGIALLSAQSTSKKHTSRRIQRASSRRDSLWSGLDELAAGGQDASLVLEEYIASGRVYMNSIIDSLMSECYRKPWVTQFVHVLINGSHDDPEKRRLFQLEVPAEMVETKYSACFRKFLDTAGCTAIGVWRPARTVVLPHPCVFVNPPPDFVVSSGDLFFLVGRPVTAEEVAHVFGTTSQAQL